MAPLLVAFASAAALVGLGDLRLAAPAAIAILLVWGLGVSALPAPKGGPGAVLRVALLLRLLLLASPPTLSDDLYRYLWEGHAFALGGDPYLFPPASAFWEALAPADTIRPLVNHPEVPSIYPPAAMVLFSLLGSLWYSPLSIKLFMGLADAATAWALADVLAGRRRRLDGAWLYALHPLGAVEAAGSGHLEAAALLCVVLAIRAWDRGKGGLGWAALGASLKLLPGVLLLTLGRHRPRALALVVAAALAISLPFWSSGAALFTGFSTYARDWSFNGSLFPLAELLLGRLARPLLVLAGAAVVVLAARRRRDPAALALWAGSAFVLLSPTVHPWYVVWAWIPALITGVRAWTVLATLIPLAYVALIGYDPATSRWTEPLWPRWIIYTPFFLAWTAESWRRLTRPGPWAPSPAPIASRSPSLTSPAPSTAARPSPRSRPASRG